jgi:hypothetical protein
MLGFHRLVDFLIQRGAELDSIDKNGCTPLQLATLAGRMTAARLLLEAGASITMRNKAGDTALDVARQQDQPDIAVIVSRHVRSRASSVSNRRQEPPVTNFHNPTRERRQVFDFADQADSDSDSYEDQASHSDWSTDEDDSPFSSGSNLKSRLSRHVSGISLPGMGSSQPSTPASSWETGSAMHEDPEDDDLTTRKDVDTSKAVRLLSSDKGCVRSPRWLSQLWQERLLSRIKLPHPPALSSWLPAQSVLPTDISQQAEPQGVQDSPRDQIEQASVQPAVHASASPSKSNAKLAPQAVRASLGTLFRWDLSSKQVA